MPPPTLTPRHASLPKPTTPGFDEQALAKARSQAEKYKPKTPSGLRMSSHYPAPSAPPISVATAPKTVSAVSAAPTVPGTTPSTPKPPVRMPAVNKPSHGAVSAASTLDDAFGSDRFARDAKWLYDNCPSGDLRELSFPEKKPLQESLGVDRAAVEIVARSWEKARVSDAYDIFNRGLQEFSATLV